MTRSWVAVLLAALAIASTGRAGEPVPPLAHGLAPAPAALPAPGPAPLAPGGCGPVGCGAPCGTPCAARHEHCNRCKKDGRSCCEKLCDWLTYRSHCTPCGECRSCMDVYPPLYLYFVVPCCKEGYHPPACCPETCCNDCHYANLLGPVCPPREKCTSGGCGGCK
jgi:hypothetical protein